MHSAQSTGRRTPGKWRGAGSVLLCGLIGLLCWGAACAAETPMAEAADERAKLRLRETTAEAGIQFRHRSPFTPKRHLHLTMGSGVGWLDYDLDGRPDLLFAQGCAWDAESGRHILDENAPNTLYRNRGDGTFEDVSRAAGLTNRAYSMGIAVGDYDNDGFPDVYVSAFGVNALYRNQGDGTFAEIAAPLGLDHPGYGASCTWTDFDADGALDLFLTNYVEIDPANYRTCQHTENGRTDYVACNPKRYRPQRDVLYRNDGRGGFVDVSDAAGITARFAKQGLGVVTFDADGDGDLDLYVANDQVANQLWINQGDGTFRERGLVMGAAANRFGLWEAGMGVAAADFNGDLRFDLVVTNYYRESNTLYRNEGPLGFLDVTGEVGLGFSTRLRLGFGISAVDVDNDGWQDLFVANGHIHDRLAYFGRQEPYEQRAQLFRNHHGRRFHDVSAWAGEYFHHRVVGRGSAVADYDGDGRLDLVVQHLNNAPALLHNETATPGKALRLRLVGTASNRDALGAVVDVETEERTLRRLRGGSTSYLSCDEGTLTVGVGPVDVVPRLIVRWLGGHQEFWENLPTGRLHLLIEGEGRPLPDADASRQRPPADPRR